MVTEVKYKTMQRKKVIYLILNLTLLINSKFKSYIILSIENLTQNKSKKHWEELLEISS